MADLCTHLERVLDAPPSGPGCAECLATDDAWWFHLRRCAECGHVGCCDRSPNRHATAHARATGHPIVQSFQIGEDWFWCYVDEVTFDVAGLEDSPSHPPGWSPGPPGRVPEGAFDA